MALKSLQEIISLEEELFAAEQLEREKASLWLKDQHVEILRQYDNEVSTVEEKVHTLEQESEVKANHDASARLQAAKDKALQVEKISDAMLMPYLLKILKIISVDKP